MKAPIDVWLHARPAGARAIHANGRTVELRDDGETVGMGLGNTLDEAIADALNDVMRRDGARDTDADELRPTLTPAPESDRG